MSPEEYVIAWAIYLGAALLCYIIWFRMTKGIPWMLVRQSLRALAVVLLFTPAQTVSQTDTLMLAPALFVVPLAWMQYQNAMLEQAIWCLVSALLFIVLVATSWVLYRNARNRAVPSKTRAGEPPTLKSARASGENP